MTNNETDETTDATPQDERAVRAVPTSALVGWRAPQPLGPADRDLIREARGSCRLTVNTIALVLAFGSPRTVATTLGGVVVAAGGGAFGLARHLLG